MAEYLIQDTTLTSIANEIRTLSGTEETLSPTEMKEKVAEGNENIATEADLIAQIQTALEGKSSGGNNGSNEEEVYELIFETDGISYLNSLDYISYDNNEYKFHSDTILKDISEYPISFSNVVLKTPITFYIDGGATAAIEIISNINYITSVDYSNNIHFQEHNGILPLSTDNGKIILRCYDDD